MTSDAFHHLAVVKIPNSPLVLTKVYPGDCPCPLKKLPLSRQPGVKHGVYLETLSVLLSQEAVCSCFLWSSPERTCQECIMQY
jgi:hypothetical protein